MTEPAGSTAGTGPGDVETLPAAPAAARALFGPRLALAEQYAELLATTGIAHGHLGPREIPRLWDRHLANCAVVGDLIAVGAAVLDVGSGAGLPGLALAISRPDLALVLLEPMARRAAFLERTVAELGLTGQVQVQRGRAEAPDIRRSLGGQTWLVARAVAPLERLLGWCLPLLAPGGHVLALKGSTAMDEVSQFRTGAPPVLRAAVSDVAVLEVGADHGLDPTYVVRVVRGPVSQRAGRSAATRAGAQRQARG